MGLQVQKAMLWEIRIVFRGIPRRVTSHPSEKRRRETNGLHICDAQGWRDPILQGNRRLPIERGTKNGRPRRTEVLVDHIEETFDAINAVLAFCRSRDFELITDCNDDL